MQRVGEPMIKTRTKNNFFDLWKNKREREREESYPNGHCAGEQRPRSPAGNQAGMEKLVIGSRTDLSGNN